MYLIDHAIEKDIVVFLKADIQGAVLNYKGLEIPLFQAAALQKNKYLPGGKIPYPNRG